MCWAVNHQNNLEMTQRHISLSLSYLYYLLIHFLRLQVLDYFIYRSQDNNFGIFTYFNVFVCIWVLFISFAGGVL
jgi:hypothetical protein